LLPGHKPCGTPNRSNRCDQQPAGAADDYHHQWSSRFVADFADYEWLTGGDAAQWLRRLAIDQPDPLKQLRVLRKDHSAARAQLLVEQAELRRRAAAKFGPLAAEMFFTRTHLEQATDRAIARYKAHRFRAQIGEAPIADYCCGIGGDLLALAARGPSVGYDLSPIACVFAQANLRVAVEHGAVANAEVHAADVTQLIPPPTGAWHVDPDRRAAGKRSTTIADYAPALSVIERWRAANSQGAVKLAPANEPPDEWAADAEFEWITCQRECRQCVGWFGGLAIAVGQSRATVVHPSAAEAERASTAGFVGRPGMPCEPADSVGAFVYDPDPSILAADLLGAISAQHGLHSIGAGGAYLTGPHAITEPMLATFAVRDILPLRVAAIVKYISAHGIGQLEIKKRGVTIDPEVLRRKLKLRGNEAAILILTRIVDRQVAVVADRLPESHAAQG
jgi:predicted RNA methylase